MPARFRSAALILSAALFVPAVSASAAVPWTDPVTIPGAFPQPAPVVITKAGHGVTVTGTDRSGAAPAGAVSEIVPLGLDGRPSGPVRGLSIATPQLASYASDRIVVAGSTLDAAGTISDHSHVQVAFGSAGGDLGPLRGIRGSTGEHSFALASNAAGDVAIVTGNTKRRRLSIRRHGAGTAFKLIFTVNVSNRARDTTVAVGPKGDILVVWEDNHHIYARHIGPTGGLGSTHRVGDGVQSHLQAAIDPTGRLLVAWLSQRVSEGEGGPASEYLATAAPGRGFGAARSLEAAAPDGYNSVLTDPGVRLVIGTDGAAFVTTTSWAGDIGYYNVFVSKYVGGHLAWTIKVSSDDQNAILSDLAAGPGGSVIVLWRSFWKTPGAQQLFATPMSSTGARIGGIETVTPPAQQLPLAPTLAVSPTTGAALTVIPSLTTTPGTTSVAARAAIGG